MTALATILALIPLSIGLNEGAIIAAELGTVVIGGLISSTFLTLVVIPVIYSYVKRDRLGEPAPAVAVATSVDVLPESPASAVRPYPMFEDLASAYGDRAEAPSTSGGSPALPIGRQRRESSRQDERTGLAAGVLVLGGVLIALVGGIRRGLARLRR